MPTNYTTNLSVLNAICVFLGGAGGHTSELAAWGEIETLLSVETPYAILEVTIPEGGATLEMYYEGEATSIHADWGDGVIEDAVLVDGVYSHPYAEGVYQAKFDTQYVRSEVELITGVIELIALTYLYLSNATITESLGLTGLTNLQYLDLSNSLIAEPPILTGLTNLQELYLSNTLITEPPILTGLTALKYIDLSGTLITEPPILAGLVSLQELELSGIIITEQGLDLLLTELADLSFTAITYVGLQVQNAIRPTQSVIDTFVLAHPSCQLYLNEA